MIVISELLKHQLTKGSFLCYNLVTLVEKVQICTAGRWSLLLSCHLKNHNLFSYLGPEWALASAVKHPPPTRGERLEDRALLQRVKAQFILIFLYESRHWKLGLPIQLAFRGSYTGAVRKVSTGMMACHILGCSDYKWIISIKVLDD